MKLGDKINLNNSKAVIVAQAKDGTFIGDNNGNLFKVTSDWKPIVPKANCPWAPGTKIINNHGEDATVISLEDYQKGFGRYNSGRRNDVFDTMTEPFVTFRYPSGAYGWDPIKYWSEVKKPACPFVVGDVVEGKSGLRYVVEKLDGVRGMHLSANGGSMGWFDLFSNFTLVRDAGCPFEIGTKLAHIDSPYVHKYTVVSKKEWFDNNPKLKPESYHKIYMNYASSPKDYVFSSMPENYCEVKTKIEVAQPLKVGDIVRAKPDCTYGVKGLLKVLSFDNQGGMRCTELKNGLTGTFTVSYYEVAKPQVGDWMTPRADRLLNCGRPLGDKVQITDIQGEMFNRRMYNFNNWELCAPGTPVEDNSGKRYFEAYDSAARDWNSLNKTYKDKWNNLAKFIANEKKGN